MGEEELPQKEDAVTGKTQRTIEGRLFPPREWDTGWSLSLQADRVGYQCSPRLRLDLEDYETVEGLIQGPFPGFVDVTTLGLPGPVLAKFALGDGNYPAIGCNLDLEDVAAIVDALNHASLNPNAGIPRGALSWPGREVWHGTDMGAATDILACGVRMEASGQGYFGRAFYVTDDRDIAIENYANFSGEEAGAVLRLIIADGANILDLRNPIDAKAWKSVEREIGNPDFDRIARRAGIAGVYDRSMGGLAIYDPRMITPLEISPVSPGSDPAP